MVCGKLEHGDNTFKGMLETAFRVHAHFEPSGEFATHVCTAEFKIASARRDLHVTSLRDEVRNIFLSKARTSGGQSRRQRIQKLLRAKALALG